jgi:hypothetical protein
VTAPINFELPGAIDVHTWCIVFLAQMFDEAFANDVQKIRFFLYKRRLSRFII